MEIPEQTENAGVPKDRPKRSRTGCLTCRTRRRKCDEQKPICQNCTAKGFECQYAAAFQILGKHNFTPEVANNAKYTNLKFVSEAQNETTHSNREGYDQTSLTAASSTVLRQDGTENRESSYFHKPRSEYTSPSTENAVHGLLAVGSRSDEQANLRARTSSSPPNEPHLVSTGAIEASPAPLTLGDRAWKSTQLPKHSKFEDYSGEQILDLLKHYRYAVAPWLDMCDLSQQFGCEVLHLSPASTTLRHRILSMAEVSMCRNKQGKGLDYNDFVDDSKSSENDPLHRLLLDTFSITRNAAWCLSTFWLEEVDSQSCQPILDSLISSAADGFSLASTIYWWIFRLVLSVTLINPRASRIPLPFTAHDTHVMRNMTQVQQCAYEAVMLCADAVMFCQGDEDGWMESRYGLTRIEIWTTLVFKSGEWFTRRVYEFEPIVELYPKDGSHSKDEFPTIVFTNETALFVNQLFHTGMFLLLQNRPRFVERQNSIFMSPMWNAHRVCGIAINNNRNECWDPCLIASLLVSAQTVTHKSQQAVILSTLERVQRHTTWDIAQHVQRLTDEWRMAEDW